jgi:methionine aminotransferase
MNNFTISQLTSPAIQTKLPTVSTTIFTVISEKNQLHNAINLSQGFPDFDCDPLLSELVAKYVVEGYNQYAPMAGIPQLREVISKYTAALYGAYYNPDTEITITSGATEALFAAITSIVKPEDEVIIFDPCYDSYVPAIELNGAIPVYIPLQYPDYSIDWGFVKKLINRNTRAIIINTPHNPCGKVLTESDMRALVDITKNNNIIVISDEVYEFIIFDGVQHQSVCMYPELAARSFKIGSFGKSLHTTGWKVGYCLAPSSLTTEFRKIHQYLTFSTATPIQLGIADYLERYPQKLNEVKALYQAKRDMFLDFMKGSRFTPIASQGTYFQLFSYKSITNVPDTEFVNRLIENFGVSAIPISVLRNNKKDDNVLRFCFAKKKETLGAAAQKLKLV